MKNLILILTFSISIEVFSGKTNIVSAPTNTPNEILKSLRLTKFTQDNEGNIYITGSFKGQVHFNPNSEEGLKSSNGSEDIFIAKYTSEGKFIWAIKIGAGEWDVGKDIVFAPSGYLYITGEIGGRFDGKPSQKVDFDPSEKEELISVTNAFDTFIAKYDLNGNLIWAKDIGGKGWEMVNGIALDKNENVFITGFYQQETDFDPSEKKAMASYKSETDFFVAKYTAEGEFAWVNTISGEGENRGNDIKVDGENNIIVCGFFEDKVILSGVKTGEVIASKDEKKGAVVVKYNNEGDLLWHKELDGLSGNVANAIAIHPKKNTIAVTGAFAKKLEVKYNNKDTALKAVGNYSCYIVEIKADGNIETITQLTADSLMSGSAVTYTHTGELFALGNFKSDVKKKGKTLFIATQQQVYLAGQFNSIAEFCIPLFKNNNIEGWALALQERKKEKGLVAIVYKELTESQEKDKLTIGFEQAEITSSLIGNRIIYLHVDVF